MRRVLVDVNVVLDVLLDRAPFADCASAVWAAVEGGEAEGLLSAHAINSLHYLNVRFVGTRMARDTTDALLSVREIAVVDSAVLRVTRGTSDDRPSVSWRRQRPRRGCE